MQTDEQPLSDSKGVYEDQKLKYTSKFGGEKDKPPEYCMVTGPVLLQVNNLRPELKDFKRQMSKS